MAALRRQLAEAQLHARAAEEEKRQQAQQLATARAALQAKAANEEMEDQRLCVVGGLLALGFRLQV